MNFITSNSCSLPNIFRLHLGDFSPSAQHFTLNDLLISHCGILPTYLPRSTHSDSHLQGGGGMGGGLVIASRSDMTFGLGTF